MGEYLKELLPAILAGVIGGLGAYVAVKIDIAVLKNNQEVLVSKQDEFKEDLRVVRVLSDRQIKQESDMKFFQFQLDAMRDAANRNVKL